MPPFRKLTCVVLYAAGYFLLYLYASWYLGGGGLPPLFVSGITDLGVLCLLIASRMVLLSYGATGHSILGPSLGQTDSTESTGWNKASVLGVVLALVALFVIFPVGCNTSVGCSMSPGGTWSTIWPNILTLNLGFVLAGWGWDVSRSRKLSLPGLGVGMIPGGMALLMLGLRTGYTTFCPAFGCAPLTASGWWSLFWPNVIADSLGVLLIAVGLLLMLLRWPKSEAVRTINSQGAETT
jgi:hypothetical protein